MKTKRTLVVLAVIALVAALLMLWLRAYYVFLATVIGLLLLGHREIWSLIRYRRLPVMDERVRGNHVNSVRNAGVFFVIAAVLLMLVLSGNLRRNVPAARIVGLLFLCVGAAYLFSYLYYDRAEPNLDDKALRWLRRFIITAGISVGVFIVSIILHHSVSGLFGIEQRVFLFVARVICPAMLAVGLLGSLAVFARGLVGSVGHKDDEREADENES